MNSIAGRSILVSVMLLTISCFAAASTAPRVAGMVPASHTDWKTFVSKSMQVALDYPADWSLIAAPAKVIFTSPQRMTIQLGVVDTGDLSPEEFRRETQLPNTRCTSKTNRHGVSVRVCFDTVSFVYAADFVIRPARGPAKLLSLVMSSRGDLKVFNAMLESARPAR